MATRGQYVTIIVAMLAAGAVVMMIALVRGPIADAAWEQPCRDLNAGRPIPGIWNVDTTNDRCTPTREPYRRPS